MIGEYQAEYGGLLVRHGSEKYLPGMGKAGCESKGEERVGELHHGRCYGCK